MQNLNTIISNIHHTIEDFKKLNETELSNQTINSKYKIVNKNNRLTDLFYKFVSFFLPSNIHIAQTTPESVIKQLSKLKNKTG